MWPEKKRTNAWQWREQETTDLAGEKRPMELKKIEEPLPKRMKSSSDDTTNEVLVYVSRFYNLYLHCFFLVDNKIIYSYSFVNASLFMYL